MRRDGHGIIFYQRKWKLTNKQVNLIFIIQNAAALPQLKKSLETDWLKQTPSQSLQQTLRDLETALKQSFKKNKNLKGFPKFKKRKEFEGSFRLVQTPSLWKFDNKTITLPKIGAVKWKYHRKLPSEFSTATISRNGNKWQISIVVSVDEKEPISIERHDQIVGIDLNSKHLVVTSDGEVIDNPKFLKKTQKKLKLRQRQLAKKTKNSNRRKRKTLQLRKIHTKIANQRKNFMHQISNQITNDYDLICMESLNVAAMQKFNGRMTGDAGWSLLQSLIEYKARLRGKSTQKIDSFAPSSKTCNTCGHQEKLTLADRTFVCSNCENTNDRDGQCSTQYS